MAEDGAAAARTKLQERLARPPETWVDVVMIAILTDPYFYGAVALGVFSVLAIAALVATKVLLTEIAKDEKRKQKQQAKDAKKKQ